MPKPGRFPAPGDKRAISSLYNTVVEQTPSMQRRNYRHKVAK